MAKSRSIGQLTGGGCLKASLPSSYTAALETPKKLRRVPPRVPEGPSKSASLGTGNNALSLYLPQRTFEA